MSDTPRTNLMVERAPIGLRANAAFEQSCDLCRQLERELNEANKRIKRLEAWIESLEILEQHSTVFPEREWFGSEIGYLRKGQFAYKGDAKP